MTRAGSTDGAKVRDAIAATKDFPGVTGHDHDQRGAQRRQAGRGPQGRERQVPADGDHQARGGERRRRATRSAAVRLLRMTTFLQQLVNGLSLGSIYALIALGYTMVYGVLRLINFAHGDVYMVGAYVGLLPLARSCRASEPSLVSALLVMLGSMIVCALLGIAHRAVRVPARAARGPADAADHGDRRLALHRERGAARLRAGSRSSSPRSRRARTSSSAASG